MPDNRGFLDAAEKEKVIQFLRSKWGDLAKCQGCGQSHWGVGDIAVAAVPMGSGSGFAFGGPTYPFVAIFCSNCGQAVLMNAIVCGIVAGDAAPKREVPSGQ